MVLEAEGMHAIKPGQRHLSAQRGRVGLIVEAQLAGQAGLQLAEILRHRLGHIGPFGIAEGPPGIGFGRALHPGMIEGNDLQSGGIMVQGGGAARAVIGGVAGLAAGEGGLPSLSIARLCHRSAMAKTERGEARIDHLRAFCLQRRAQQSAGGLLITGRGAQSAQRLGQRCGMGGEPRLRRGRGWVETQQPQPQQGEGDGIIRRVKAQAAEGGCGGEFAEPETGADRAKLHRTGFGIPLPLIDIEGGGALKTPAIGHLEEQAIGAGGQGPTRAIGGEFKLRVGAFGREAGQAVLMADAHPLAR